MRSLTEQADYCNEVVNSKTVLNSHMKESLKYKADHCNSQQALEYLLKCEDVPAETLNSIRGYIVSREVLMLEKIELAKGDFKLLPKI